MPQSKLLNKNTSVVLAIHSLRVVVVPAIPVSTPAMAVMQVHSDTLKTVPPGQGMVIAPPGAGIWYLDGSPSTGSRLQIRLASLVMFTMTSVE